MPHLKKKRRKYKLPDNILDLMEDLEIEKIPNNQLNTYQSKHKKAKSKLQQIKQSSIKNIHNIKKKMKKKSNNYINRLRSK